LNSRSCLVQSKEAYPILLASSNTIPYTDTDTEYDVIRTTHQCHKFISTGQCYSHSHYRRRSDRWTVCDMRRARWGLYSRKVVNGGRLVGDTVLSYVRPAFVNSYSGVCGRRREGQTCVRACGRAGDRASLQSPLSLCHHAAPPPARRRLTGTPVRSRNTDGRACDVRGGAR